MRILLLLAAALLLAACSGEEATPTPPAPPALDLYLVPAAATATSSGANAWPARLAAVRLATRADDPTRLSVPEGGRTDGRVIQLALSDDGLSVEEVPVLARVVARGSDGLLYNGTVEASAFSHHFTLRAPAGLYDVWIEPWDRGLIPHWERGVALPQGDLPVVVPEGVVLRGTLTDGADPAQPIVGAQVTTRSPADRTRTGGLATTGETGAFSLRVPAGIHEVWVRRDGRADDDDGAVLLPATPLTLVDVPAEGLSGLALTAVPPATSPVIGEVTWVDRWVDGVEVTATLQTASPREGALRATTLTGAGNLATQGSFAFDLPAGAWVLSLTPPTTSAEPLAPLTWRAGEPFTMPGSTDLGTIPLGTYIVGLRGELLTSDGTPARGASLLFVPGDDLPPVVGTNTRGELGTFIVGVSPPGGAPVALAPGSHEVVIHPPLGSAWAGEHLSFNAGQGQTRLELPVLPAGYAVYGRLEVANVARYTDAVVKAVPAGVETWGLRWGPGPDPRDVVAEGRVAEDGTFSLRLPWPAGG